MNMESQFFLGVILLFTIFGSVCGYQCAEKPRKLGCFQDKQKDRLMTHAFSVKMKPQDWIGNNWNEHLNILLCECSKRAKKDGYLYFGLQHYYECWVGNMNHVADIGSLQLKDKKSCWSKHPNYSMCKPADQTCVGKPFTMAIYEVTYSTYVIPETEAPTVKTMTLPNKGSRPAPFVPGPPPGFGRR